MEQVANNVTEPKHVPVMLERCIALLAPAISRPNSIVIDATLGLAGQGFGTAVKGGAVLGGTTALGETEDLTNIPQTLKDVAGAGALRWCARIACHTGAGATAHPNT